MKMELIGRLMRGRWMMAVAAFYILSCSGATYIFGLYSGAIKRELHYNQETIDTMAFFKDVGANVGIAAGIMYDILPPWVILSVGGLMNLFGYLMIWLAVTHRIARPPIWQMNLFICVGANSQAFTNTGAMVTFVKNFPQGRGEVLGILKGFVGLSGAMFTQAYHALYYDDARGAIFLIAVLPSLVTFLFMLPIRALPLVNDPREKRSIYSFLYLALLTAAFLTLAIIVENVMDISPGGYKAFGAVTVMLIVSNVVIGIRAECAYMNQERSRDLAMDGKKSQELLAIANGAHNGGITTTFSGKPHSSCDVITNDDLQYIHHKTDATLSDKSQSPCNVIANGELQHKHNKTDISVPTEEKPGNSLNKPIKSSSTWKDTTSSNPTLGSRIKLYFNNWPKRGDDFTIPQALLSLDLWLLFLSLTCGVGAALAAVDNMGQIGESLGYSSKSISTFVSLISIWNFLGRVSAGFGSEILLRRYRCPRTLILSIVLVIACIGHVLIAFPASNTLYIASIIVGFCFGAQLALYFAIVSELFGLKYYGTLHSVGGIASPLGAYLLNVRVAGHLYDVAALRQNPQAGGNIDTDLKCIGHDCFRLSFLIMTIVSGFGSLISCVLALRTRSFYNQDIYGRFILNEERQCEREHTKRDPQS